MRTPRLRRALGTGVALLATAVAIAGCAARTRDPDDRSQGVRSVVRAVVDLVHGGTTTPSTPRQAPSASASTAVSASAEPCAGNTRAQFIRVSISNQHAWLCSREHLVYDTAVTTGMTGSKDTRTPTGSFEIQGRNTDTTLDPGTGEAFPVKYWIPFQAPAFGFHDSSWQKFPYGSQRYRTDGSHGCVHMPLAAMVFLYDWVHVGATVHIVA